MLTIDAETVAARLPYERLVPALRTALAEEHATPLRMRYDLPDGANLLLMPAWDSHRLGVKIVNVFPRNVALGRSAISSSYVLSDAATGEMEALIDGEALTTRRTAATAALAADFLAPAGADRLLLVGAGHVARELPAAFASVRPIGEMEVWARNPARAQAFAADLAAQGHRVLICYDLAKAVKAASIVACATFATDPIVHGDWLGPQTHLSLIGGFRPNMREADSEAIRRSYVVADTRDGVLAEAGDVAIPMQEQVVAAEHVRADLFQLCRGEASVPPNLKSPTLFKSVGHARQDLAAARLCVTPASDYAAEAAPTSAQR